MQELTYLKDKIRALQDNRTEALIHGGAKDYPKYTQIVGEITGLTLALSEIDDLQHNIKKANND